MRNITLAIMALVIGFSAMAQTGDSTSQKENEFRNRPGHLGNQNLEKLNLTEDQKARLKTLNESFRQQMQDVTKNTNVSGDELKEKRQALIKEHREKVDVILTPEQRKQAEDMKQEFSRENKGEMRGERFEEMTKDLNLTPEQSTKMK